MKARKKSRQTDQTLRVLNRYFEDMYLEEFAARAEREALMAGDYRWYKVVLGWVMCMLSGGSTV